MFLIKPVKYFLLPMILLYVACTTYFTANTEKSTEEPLIPREIVNKHLEGYNEEEKKLISYDLENINNICLREKVPSADNKRVYVASAGGPGACKSTILETYILDKPHLVYADPDPRSLRFMINTYYQTLSYYNISKSESYQALLEEAYTKWRWASNYIACSILNEAYQKGYNIAHGTTSTSPAIKFLYDKLKKKGYKIVLLLCYASDKTRIKALDHRAEKQSFVQCSPEDAINKGKMFCQRFPTYFKFADELHFYWTEDFKQGSVHAATYTKENGLISYNDAALKSFIQKYDADRVGSDLPSFDNLMS